MTIWGLFLLFIGGGRAVGLHLIITWALLLAFLFGIVELKGEYLLSFLSPLHPGQPICQAQTWSFGSP